MSTLRDLRELRGLGLREMATLAHFTPATLSRIERQGYPRADQLYRIARVLGLKGLTDPLETLFPELQQRRA